MKAGDPGLCRTMSLNGMRQAAKAQSAVKDTEAKKNIAVFSAAMAAAK
jgi:hypothetical protein